MLFTEGFGEYKTKVHEIIERRQRVALKKIWWTGKKL